VDDLVAMGKRSTLMNAYWEDKIPDFSKIKIPATPPPAGTTFISAAHSRLPQN
jgi:hypothetical protein